ncbi:MAG: fused MFS/spermidine synthase [Azonexus sp.]|nr:fused MFS/spermidine synthase [Azonexus sp.]
MKKRSAAPRHAIDISEADGIRYLHFGSDWVQGAMRIARPWSLELAYTRDMMAGLLLRDAADWPRRALLIGLGAGSLVKFLYRHRPLCRITVVEINPRVEWIARQYFRLPDAPRRITINIGCGADFMLGGDSLFDFILVDGFDADARPGPLATLPFYQACRARLTAEGICCVNLLGHQRGSAASAERIGEAFSGARAVFPATASGNVIVFATGETPVDLPLATLRDRTSALKTASGLDLRPLISRLQLHHPLPQGRLLIGRPLSLH